MERLDKLLASTGQWSRSQVKELVRQGRVRVDGIAAGKPEQKCDPAQTVAVDGVPVGLQKFVYVMMNKPAGWLSATEDKRQQTVLDLLDKPLQRRGLFPVGRLDKDTTGLLLLTDDGELAHRLLAPRSHVDKVYLARVDGRVNEEDAAAFRAGLVLDDGLECLPADLQPLEDGSRCLVTLREGKFHQVKRMLAFRGKPVLELKRLSMGPLGLDETLAPGQWRELSEREVEFLRTAVSERN
ncbi:MAG: rRNA pseudouridine synthase [Oscillospiraceae bacterium]|nr:rRNA pseudouridine synthase [Oscillospiraceae bacterium]